MSTATKLLVRQVKGEAGRPWTARLVLRGLGLRGPGSSVVVANDRPIRGMIRKVLHLVTVEETQAVEETAKGPKAAPAAKKGKS
jgi:large subunit ribosomal protein L30